MMTPTSFEIVGSFYRPPAKAILGAIPVGTPLELRPEPTNPYDPNAIAIWIKTEDIPETSKEALFCSGADCGFKIGEDNIGPDEFLNTILLAERWHLGYVRKEIAKTLQLLGPVPGRFAIIGEKFAITTTPE